MKNQPTSYYIVCVFFYKKEKILSACRLYFFPVAPFYQRRKKSEKTWSMRKNGGRVSAKNCSRA